MRRSGWTQPIPLVAVMRLLASAGVVAAVLAGSFERSSREDSVAVIETDDGRVTVHAAGRGKPYLNLRDGRSMSVLYRGDREAAAVLANRLADARSLASAPACAASASSVKSALMMAAVSFPGRRKCAARNASARCSSVISN